MNKLGQSKVGIKLLTLTKSLNSRGIKSLSTNIFIWLSKAEEQKDWLTLVPINPLENKKPQISIKRGRTEGNKE